MLNQKVSVLIITRDRLLLLKRCLESLVRQSKLINQIVVVDNGSRTAVKKIIPRFKKYFKITCVKEFHQGESFARNKALKFARGGILVFIDDDCIADRNWLKEICFCFETNPDCIGLLGKSENLYKKNIWANIIQCYYNRWLMENFKDITQPQTFKENNNFFDTKNLSFKKELTNGFSFAPVSYNINTDSLAGHTLLKKGKFIYNPKAIVYHNNTNTLKSLFFNNFIRGMSDQFLLSKKKIDLRARKNKYLIFKWLKVCYKEVSDLSYFSKGVFWIFLFLFPISYKMGRFIYKVKNT